MSRTKETTGTVTVSKWNKESKEWMLYSTAHDHLLIDFEEVRRDNEVMPEDAQFIYEFESDCEANIKTYFCSYEYCL
jgi:hypothetical protein